MRKKGPARRRPGMVLRKYQSSKRTITRVFTETLVASDLQLNANLTATNPGQVWVLNMQSVPQYSAYKDLYNEYKILKIRYQFVPYFSSEEKNQALYNIGTGGPVNTVPFLAYSIEKSPDDWATPPANEVAVLTRNNSRIVPFSTTKVRNITINNPVPELYLSTSGGPSVNMNKPTWLSLQDASLVNHGGLVTYVTDGGSSGVPASVGRTYAHITFALRGTI